MIALGTGRTNKSGKISESACFVVAFLFLTSFIFVLERAHKLHNHIHWTSGTDPNADTESTTPSSHAKADGSVDRLARALDAQIILGRNLTTDQATIPKIFHQSWVDHNLPKKFEEWSQSCRRMHPDWEWVLWTNEDNHDLVKKYAPWFLETYEALQSEILRADAARNIYMHVFGG